MRGEQNLQDTSADGKNSWSWSRGGREKIFSVGEYGGGENFLSSLEGGYGEGENNFLAP